VAIPLSKNSARKRGPDRSRNSLSLPDKSGFLIKAEHDPLASHIFISRRHYRNANDTKGGKRREMNARLSFNIACELGFRGSLDEWERPQTGDGFASNGMASDWNSRRA
jgi:hypothetical protein